MDPGLGGQLNVLQNKFFEKINQPRMCSSFFYYVLVKLKLTKKQLEAARATKL